LGLTSNRDALNQPIVTANYVPNADGGDLKDLTFVAVSRMTKAAVQIAVSATLNWRDLVQRNPMATSSLSVGHPIQWLLPRIKS